MSNWYVNFQNYRPIRSMPRLLVVASEEYDGPDYRHEGRFRRSENHCLFKYTLSGEGRFRCTGGEHTIGPGTGFLCRVSDPQTAYYYPPGGREPWRFVYTCFAGPVATAMVDELVQRFGHIYELPVHHPSIEALLGWESYAGAQPTISLAQKARLVLDLLTDLAAEKETPQSPSDANELTRKAQQLIERNLQENLNATQLAQILDVSREHLTRVFKEQTGQTLYRYMLRRRMLLACHLLKEADLTNKQIAARLGCTPAQFSRSFRSVIHLTPTQFRKVGIIPVG